ncbi:MAG: DUF4864 domain-containing protein [Pseudomonadota bacterium]
MLKRLVGPLFLVAAFIAGFTTGMPKEAQADGSAIRDVIAAQLDAFQRDDFDEAFTYASPIIQHVFRNSAHFGAMVKQGYPMVYRPEGVRFGDSSERNDVHYQLVTFSDTNGRAYVAEYEMLELDGAWKINGVRLLQDVGLGA